MHASDLQLLARLNSYKDFLRPVKSPYLLGYQLGLYDRMLIIIFVGIYKIGLGDSLKSGNYIQADFFEFRTLC